jgi:shikimate dehydrogenase
VWALREAGAEVSVWNRGAERAAVLARELGVAHATRPESADIVVNATAVGLVDEEEQAAVEALGVAAVEAATFVDLVYGGEPTALSRWAAGRGARVVDGIEVLVRQGARSFELWTGREAPVAVMREAAAQPPV